MRVVAVPAARAAVEADEREVRRQLERLEAVHLRAVADHERDVPLAQRLHHLWREPALVPELDRVAHAGG